MNLGASCIYVGRLTVSPPPFLLFTLPPEAATVTAAVLSAASRGLAGLTTPGMVDLPDADGVVAADLAVEGVVA